MARLDRRARNTRRTSARPKWYGPAVGAFGLLLLAVGIWVGLRSTSGSTPNLTPQADGPRLMVDRELIDLGVQPVDRLVTATFQVSNQGAGPLHILDEPVVELVEGC